MNRCYLLAAVLLGTGAISALSLQEPAKPTLDNPDVVRLAELLYSRQDALEQAQAALMLVQLGSEESMEIVGSGLQRWDRPDVFQALSAAIRLRRDTRYLNALLKALACEQPAIRQSAVDTVARLGPEKTVRPLLAMAEDANAPPIARQAAALALGRSMHKSAVVPLMSLLSSDSQAVRQTAAAALEELTGQSFGHDFLKWQAWWEQKKEVSDEEWVAARAVHLSDRNRRLRDELHRAEQQIVQLHQALYAKVPPADRLTHLQTLAQNEYPAVRTQAVTWIVENLAEVNQPDQKRLVDLLLQLSDDGVEVVQRQAVLALEKVPDQRGFDRLITLLAAGPISVRAAAARSLGRCRAGKDDAECNKKALAALEKALGDKSLTVVAEAAESLGGLGVPEAATILAGLLKHPSDVVRQAAARALEQVANPSVHQEIYADLEDPVAAVRFSLVGALGRSGASGQLDEAQKAELLKRLSGVLVHDSDPGVRSRAAAVLGDIGTPAELTLLWQRVKATEDERVQLKAWAAMIDILARSTNWKLVSQWDQKLAAENESNRRIDMLTEVRTRWLTLESTRPHWDDVSGALTQALLTQRRWNAASPLALDLAKKAKREPDLQRALRWLLVAGSQALEDKKPQETLRIIKDCEELLKKAGNDLAIEFDALRGRANRALEP